MIDPNKRLELEVDVGLLVARYRDLVTREEVMGLVDAAWSVLDDPSFYEENRRSNLRLVHPEPPSDQL